jgi:hypothetical protein
MKLLAGMVLVAELNIRRRHLDVVTTAELVVRGVASSND